MTNGRSSGTFQKKAMLLRTMENIKEKEYIGIRYNERIYNEQFYQ